MANAIVTTRDTQLEKQRISKNQISLTEFDTTNEPAIAAGSVVEIGGSLFVVTVDEAITGWAGIGNNTDAYIKLVPDVADFAAEFTTDAPTWSASKQGWYDGVDRYVGGLHRGATAADYESKWVYQPSQDNNASHRFYGDGTVDFDDGIKGDLGVGGDVTLSSDAHHLDGTKKVRGSIHLVATTEDVVFDALDAYMSTTGDEILISGLIEQGDVVLVVCRAKRASSTSIVFYGARADNGVLGNWGMTDGSATAVQEISIAW